MPCKSLNWLFLLLCSISFCTSAATIHSWIDADGITHFSDIPPATDVTDATIIELSDKYPPLPDPEADYYSIANQWNRMREERDAKNKLSLERARIRAEESTALVSLDATSGQRNYGGYYPIYGLPGRHVNQIGTGFHGADRRSAFDRGPHHVQAGHGRLGRANRRARHSSGLRGGHRGSRLGSGVSFGFSLK